jgi:periplasmic protein TonB
VPEDKLQPTTAAAAVAPADETTEELAQLAAASARAQFAADLSRHFSYPPIARQRGWQGNVRVEFRVEADGRLTNIRIAQSSGYDVLDSSALKALHEVGYLREARTWLNGQAIDIELPVIYRLEEH